MVGDSTACTMIPGLEAVGAPAGVRIENAAVIGCGVVSGWIAPDVVNGRDVNRASRLCQVRAEAADAKALQSGRPNVVLWASSWERNSLSIGSGAKQQTLLAGSPEWSTLLLNRMGQRVRELTATGATVVMVTQPPFVDQGQPAGPTAQDESFLRLNNLLVAFARNRPQVEVVDLADYVCPSGPPCPLVVDNVGARGDGAHYTADGSLWVARWLMPKLGIPSLDHLVAVLPTVRVVGLPRGTVLTGSRCAICRAVLQPGRLRGPVRRERCHRTVTGPGSGAFYVGRVGRPVEHSECARRHVPGAGSGLQHRRPARRRALPSGWR